MSFLWLLPDLQYSQQDTLQAHIRSALERLCQETSKISPGERVAIKINLAAAAPPESAACTHPELLRAVIAVLKEYQAEIVVVEDCDEVAIRTSGTARVLAESKVPFLNLRTRPYKQVSIDGYLYEYAQDVLRSERILSLPKLKTHLYTYYTGAIKNMFGCIPKYQRRELHREMATSRFSEHLVNIYSIRPPDLVILDGILAMEGIGPTRGTPKAAGLLLISDDGVILDHFAAQLIGYKPDQVDMIRIAMQRGLYRCPPEAVDFPGASWAVLPRLKWNCLPIVSGTRRKQILQALCGPIQVTEEHCQMCGKCAESCPFDAIQLDPYPVVDRDLCQYCFCCLELCPHMAIMPAKFHYSDKAVA